MKKMITFILAAISILSISILFTGCGTQTVEDITGEYIWIENGKEKQEANKHYYLLILEKETTYKNKSAVKLRLAEQRYNPDIDKYYYVNRDFYVDPKTLQAIESQSEKFSINENKNIVINKVQYKKISSNNVKPDDTNYTAESLRKDLIKIPKFSAMNDTHIPDPFSGYTTELRKYIYY